MTRTVYLVLVLVRLWLWFGSEVGATWGALHLARSGRSDRLTVISMPAFLSYSLPSPLVLLTLSPRRFIWSSFSRLTLHPRLNQRDVPEKQSKAIDP